MLVVAWFFVEPFEDLMRQGHALRESLLGTIRDARAALSGVEARLERTEAERDAAVAERDDLRVRVVELEVQLAVLRRKDGV